MLLTKCCHAYDTFWGDLHVCRQCHMPNPTMVEIEDKCRKCGDWIEIHDGKTVCKSGCPQELTLPQLDSHDDGPIDGYDY